MAAERPRFLVAPDSFKGTFVAAEVAAAIGDGIAAGGGDPDLCPVADGGEGTTEVLLGALGGSWRPARVSDPLRRSLEARFGLLEDGAVAVLDAAAACGLPLLLPRERDPERADTYGVGELIAAAIAAGARRILIAAGGSASTDGGLGAIEALRERGGPRGAVLEVLCDVRTPFEEAAAVFAPQKGAGPAAVARLRARLERLATELPRDPRGAPMGGCAGGLSGGLMAAFDAELRPGAEFVLAAVGFERRLARADAVVGGEGRFDEQSLQGKIVGILAERCAAAGRPLHLLVGSSAFEGPLPRGVASLRTARDPDQLRRAAEEIAAAG